MTQKKLLFILLFLSIRAISFAQNTFQIGNNTAFEVANAILALPNKEFLIGGAQDANGLSGLLIKVDSTGKTIWTKKVPNVIIKGLVKIDNDFCYALGEKYDVNIELDKAYLAKVPLDATTPPTELALNTPMATKTTSFVAGAATKDGFVFVGSKVDSEKIVQPYLYRIKNGVSFYPIYPDTINGAQQLKATSVVAVGNTVFVACDYDKSGSLLLNLNTGKRDTFMVKSDISFLTMAKDSSFLLGNDAGFLALFDKNGNKIKQINIGAKVFAGIADSTFYVTGATADNNLFLRQLDKSLNTIYNEALSIPKSKGNALAFTNKGLMVVGDYTVLSDVSILGFIKNTKTKKTYTLKGKVSATKDCNLPAIKDLDQWNIEATMYGKKYNAVSNKGVYELVVDTIGQVQIQAVKVYGWDVCEKAGISATVLASGVQNPISDLIIKDTTNLLPYLHVDFAPNVIKKTGNTVYYGVVTNNTINDVPFVKVYTKFSSQLVEVSASLPSIAPTPDSLIVSIGTVKANSKAYFTVTRKIVNPVSDPKFCYHAEAEVRPYETAWKGPRLKIDGVCNGSKVTFKIYNSGTDSIPSDILLKNGIIIIDDLVYRTKLPQVKPGETKTLEFNLGGGTYTLVCFQGNGINLNPYGNTVARKVQACTSGTSYQSELKYLDGDDDYSYSYHADSLSTKTLGNTITVVPTGFLDNNKIGQIMDTISTIEITAHYKKDKSTKFIELKAELSTPYNLKNLELGVCQEGDYTVKMIGNNTILFTITDVKTTALDTAGFLNFRIKIPLKDNKDSVFTVATSQRTEPAGAFLSTGKITQIVRKYGGFAYQGTVAILELVPVAPLKKILVSPNPFSESTSITVEEDLLGASFEILNVQGTLIQKMPITQTSFRLDAENLPRGMYLCRIAKQGRILANGKMVIQ